MIFIEQEREGEREVNINVWVASCAPPMRDLAHNPGMCPDWESNQRPFGSQAGAESTEPHQPGPKSHFYHHFGVIVPQEGSRRSPLCKPLSGLLYTAHVLCVSPASSSGSPCLLQTPPKDARGMILVPGGPDGFSFHLYHVPTSLMCLSTFGS